MYLSDRTGFDIILITDSRGGTPSKKTISKGTETMKKLLAAICILLLACVLFAEVRGVVNFKPYFKFDNTPAADVETEGFYNNIGWKQAVGPQLEN